MPKQERAVRTRDAIIRAAAVSFDSAGYDATTLARVSRGAGLSLGALSFHFPTKEDLADAVRAIGQATTRTALGRVARGGGAVLPALAAVTIEVAWLLETDVAVRAAARLSRERPNSPNGPGSWVAAWRPTAEGLVRKAAERGELPPEVDSAAVLALADCLVAGAEARIRARQAPAVDRQRSCAAWLAMIWRVVLPALGPQVTTEQIAALG